MADLRSFRAMLGLPGRLGRFAKDTTAATTVEFALIRGAALSDRARWLDVNPAIRFKVPAANGIGIVRILYPVNNYFGFINKSVSPLAATIGTTNVVMGIAAFVVEPGATGR